MTFESKIKNIAGEEIHLRSYAFKDAKPVMCAYVNGCRVLCSDAVDSLQKVEQFQHVIEELAQRFLFFQADLPSVEWEKIEAESNWVAELNACVGYLNFPFPAFFRPAPVKPHENIVKVLHHLSHIQNMEGWSLVSEWMDKEMENTLRSFIPEMIDEYQLEAKLKDFHHEVASILLRDARTQIKACVHTLNQTGNQEELRAIAKELLRAREKQFDLMKAHLNALEMVEKGIQKIEAAHPELMDLKHKVIVYKLLLTDEYAENQLHWQKRLLLSQLLCIGLKATPVVTGGQGRALLECALRVAMILVEKRFPQENVLHMVLFFDRYEREMWEHIKTKGTDDFTFWLRTPDSAYMQPFYAFKHALWHSLMELEMPVKALQEIPLNFQTHTDILKLVPPFVQEGDTLVPLIDTNPLTGAPEALTDEAYHSLERVFSWH